MRYLLDWVIFGWAVPVTVFVTLFRVFPARPRRHVRELPCERCYPAFWAARPGRASLISGEVLPPARRGIER